MNREWAIRDGFADDCFLRQNFPSSQAFGKCQPGIGSVSWLEPLGKVPIASGDVQSLPLFQQLTRSDPPRSDDLHPLSAVAAIGRRSSLRAGHRHLPRDGSVPAEPFRSDVLPRRLENVVFRLDRFHTGVGTWTRCLSGSTEKRIIYGER